MILPASSLVSGLVKESFANRNSLNVLRAPPEHISMRHLRDTFRRVGCLRMLTLLFMFTSIRTGECGHPLHNAESTAALSGTVDKKLRDLDRIVSKEASLNMLKGNFYGQALPNQGDVATKSYMSFRTVRRFLQSPPGCNKEGPCHERCSVLYQLVDASRQALQRMDKSGKTLPRNSCVNLCTEIGKVAGKGPKVVLGPVCIQKTASRYWFDQLRRASSQCPAKAKKCKGRLCSPRISNCTDVPEDKSLGLGH